MTNFNSSLVRLRGSDEEQEFSLEDNFNSSLVRLRVHKFGLTHRCNILFQFQFGAIKSYVKNRMNDPKSLFQFQFGAIKRKNKKS